MNAYIKRFLSSMSAENVIGLFSSCNNAPKELTESLGLFSAAMRFVPDVNDRVVVVVGDGVTPRTGAIFAYFSEADVVSVDPIFDAKRITAHFSRQEHSGNPVKRLRLIYKRIEDVDLASACSGKHCLVVWPHSHARMASIRLGSPASRIDVSLPCCHPPDTAWARQPHIVYDDPQILSDKRTVHVWLADQQPKQQQSGRG